MAKIRKKKINNYNNNNGANNYRIMLFIYQFIEGKSLESISGFYILTYFLLDNK